jgi:hypothetical protein
MTAALSAEFRRGSGLPYIHGNALYYAFKVEFFLYEAARSVVRWAPFFWDPRAAKLPRPSALNAAIQEIWESCESTEGRRAVVGALLGLYAVKAHEKPTPRGAIAGLMLELHVRSSDEHWLRAAPGAMRAGGDRLPANEWKKLADQARLRRRKSCPN